MRHALFSLTLGTVGGLAFGAGRGGLFALVRARGAACAVPAWYAARTEPADALRES